MFFILVLLLVTASAANVRRDTCSADQCFNALQNADSASSDCSAMMDAVTTVTHSETFLTGIEVQTTYSTSPVTMFQMPTGAPEDHGTEKAKRQAANAPATPADPTARVAMPSYASSACNGSAQYSSACSCIGVPESTFTYPLFTAVATSTNTVTFSEVARATQTAAACDPTNNYGYFNGTLNVNSRYNGVGFPIGEPYTQSLSNMTAGQCCDACFTNPAGCISYAYSANGTCILSLFDGGCPNGAGCLEVICYPNEEKPAIGIGPCDVKVETFIDD